eukprot:m.263301 g.263301  ORF g.263301 m.263301 type:complete len:130 (-) comp19706_c0_seq32:666-1055(-)
MTTLPSDYKPDMREAIEHAVSESRHRFLAVIRTYSKECPVLLMMHSMHGTKAAMFQKAWIGLASLLGLPSHSCIFEKLRQYFKLFGFSDREITAFGSDVQKESQNPTVLVDRTTGICDDLHLQEHPCFL